VSTFTTAESPFKVDNTASNRCGVTLMNNQVGAVVAEVMRHKPNVTVTPLPSMIRVDADGRMIHEDDRTIMFANPEDAADLIGFDLKASTS
jgi:propane monooxygenase coupling protein